MFDLFEIFLVISIVKKVNFQIFETHGLVFKYKKKFVLFLQISSKIIVTEYLQNRRHCNQQT